MGARCFQRSPLVATPVNIFLFIVFNRVMWELKFIIFFDLELGNMLSGKLCMSAYCIIVVIM